MPNRDADRTLITTVGCVVRRGPKSGRGSPKGGVCFGEEKKSNLLDNVRLLERQAHFGRTGTPTEH